MSNTKLSNFSDKEKVCKKTLESKKQAIIYDISEDIENGLTTCYGDSHKWSRQEKKL